MILLAFFNVHNINYLEQFILPLILEIALDFMVIYHHKHALNVF
jgi:hypothetical protein